MFFRKKVEPTCNAVFNAFSLLLSIKEARMNYSSETETHMPRDRKGKKDRKEESYIGKRNIG